MTDPKTMLKLADEIEHSQGLLCMVPRGIRSLGIRRTAVVITALRLASRWPTAIGERELDAIRAKMKRLKETECYHSGKMDEALLYGLHSAVERYLKALAVFQPQESVLRPKDLP